MIIGCGLWVELIVFLNSRKAPLIFLLHVESVREESHHRRSLETSAARFVCGGPRALEAWRTMASRRREVSVLCLGYF
jgi:hypothetical protein